MEILPELIKSFELPEDKAIEITEKLELFLFDLDKCESDADNLIIVDINDKDSMSLARDKRLFLKQMRIKIQKVLEEQRSKVKKRMEKDLNEDKFYLKASQKFDEVFKRIETKFEDKEKFAERKEAERKQQLKSQRLEELSPYSEFVPFGIDLAEATEDDYKRLLNGAKAQKRIQDEEKEREEKERIEEQKKRDELLRRREMFFNAGFKFHDFQFIYRKIMIPWSHIENINTDEFEQLFQRSINTKNEMDALEIRTQNRVSKLLSLGMVVDRDAYILNIEDVGGQVFPLINLTELSDDDFAIEYQKIKAFRDNAEQVLKDKMLAEAREKERIQEIENQRRDQLFEIGFGTFAGTFNYKGFLKTTPSIIYSLSDEEFDNFKNLAIEKIKEIQAEELANAQARIKADLEAKAKKEAEELALKSANAPDKEKLLEFAQKLDQMVLPVVSGEYANKIAFNTQGLIKKTVIYLTKQIQENL